MKTKSTRSCELCSHL